MRKASRVGKVKKNNGTNAEAALDDQRILRPNKRAGAQIERQPSISLLRDLQHASNSDHQTSAEPLTPSNNTATTSPPKRCSPPRSDHAPILNLGLSFSGPNLPSTLPSATNRSLRLHEEASIDASYGGGSPNLADLLLPGTDMDQSSDSSELLSSMSLPPCHPGLTEFLDPLGIAIQESEDVDEQIFRDLQSMEMSDSPWKYRASSPALSDVSTTSSRSSDMSLLRAPPLDPSSPEMLMLRFDRETCGILSVKNGPSENPWRTLIWPLAKSSHALYHAISSMAALHGALRDPKLRLTGMAHMTQSIKKLSTELAQMSLDEALATTLALALSEGWDEKISTGIQHLTGAKIMLQNALTQRNRSMQSEEAAQRLKFLCNTYVYMDVIARLTSAEAQTSVDLENIVQAVNGPFDGNFLTEVDPLMGCATTLFPVMGKVASLVHKIWRTNSNSLNIVSEANELREQLLHWQPPRMDFIEPPEDPQSSVRHAIQTAEAYRRAILLHLHQAVPELDTEASSHAQAKNILTVLASTPLSSRTLIIQIFPLLVGSCEMVSPEDRQWVTWRWEAMLQRLSIVNVSSCWKIVQEVWRRRDMHIQEQARGLASRSFGKHVSLGLLIPLNLRRRMQPAEAIADDALFDISGHGDMLFQDYDNGSTNRRFTSNPSRLLESGIASSGRPSPLPRRRTDITISNLDPEYTVKGNLHWLGVMDDWNWEGELSLLFPQFVAMETS
ncbi:hypothetical protein H2198_006206 [Neophaeococcomyces mojaviensis]|uniref:Uncharacterized protein n=1 Tax=Neophaeococcomyces mojaviensis TaxID=3383035 RepID=A0ACC3A3G8_9EURO|nr:hypothetical protein H2198_006206 [Knufia sp. JES_112]